MPMTVYVLDLHTLTQADVDALFSTLPPFRKEDAKRCRRKEGYVQSVAGFCLVRYALKQTDPQIDTDTWTFAENGKPSLAVGHPYFNLSHTAHCVAVALSDQEEIGVDVEKIKPRSMAFAKKFCSDTELAMIQAASDQASEMIRVWSAKEAVAKQSGVGIKKGARELCTDTAKSVRLAANGIPHWLSVSPATTSPSIIWVDKKELLI